MTVLRSGAVVLAANMFEVACGLLRNIVLARLLSVEQFGIAATFAILMTLIETFQNAGLSRMIVQDREADEPHFMASLHGAQLVIGLCASVLMAALTWPYAQVMGTPYLLLAYLAMAAIPLVTALTHLETFRMQRQGRFGPQALRSFVSQPIGLLAIWPGYWWFGDYRAALVAIFAQQIAAMLLSHVATGRRFALAHDRAIWRRALAFGWPLTLNGLLMFWVVNGDRAVVVNQFGPAMLGLFSAALMLTMAPTNLMAKTAQTLVLPALARSRDDDRRFAQIYSSTVSALTLVGLAMALVLIGLGKPVLQLLFGAKYLPAAQLLVLLAWMNGLRLIRAAPVIAAMARGETRNPLYANLVRAAAIPVALAVAITTGNLLYMIAAGIAGEVAAAFVSSWLARRSIGLSSRHYLTCVGLSLLCIAAAIVSAWVSLYALLAAVPLLIATLVNCSDALRIVRLKR